MSEEGPVHTPPPRPRRRAKGAPRGGRHGLSRNRPNVAAASGDPVLQGGSAVAGAPQRHTGAPGSPPLDPFTREREFLFIRADMQRLFVVAGALLTLMLLILFVVGR